MVDRVLPIFRVNRMPHEISLFAPAIKECQRLGHHLAERVPTSHLQEMVQGTGWW